MRKTVPSRLLQRRSHRQLAASCLSAVAACDDPTVTPADSVLQTSSDTVKNSIQNVH